MLPEDKSVALIANPLSFNNDTYIWQRLIIVGPFLLLSRAPNSRLSLSPGYQYTENRKAFLDIASSISRMVMSRSYSRAGACVED
jgi:hypothetical protein